MDFFFSLIFRDFRLDVFLFSSLYQAGVQEVYGRFNFRLELLLCRISYSDCTSRAIIMADFADLAFDVIVNLGRLSSERYAVKTVLPTLVGIPDSTYGLSISLFRWVNFHLVITCILSSWLLRPSLCFATRS